MFKNIFDTETLLSRGLLGSIFYLRHLRGAKGVDACSLPDTSMFKKSVPPQIWSDPWIQLEKKINTTTSFSKQEQYVSWKQDCQHSEVMCQSPSRQQHNFNNEALREFKTAACIGQCSCLRSDFWGQWNPQKGKMPEDGRLTLNLQNANQQGKSNWRSVWYLKQLSPSFLLDFFLFVCFFFLKKNTSLTACWAHVVTWTLCARRLCNRTCVRQVHFPTFLWDDSCKPTENKIQEIFGPQAKCCDWVRHLRPEVWMSSSNCIKTCWFKVLKFCETLLACRNCLEIFRRTLNR